MFLVVVDVFNLFQQIGRCWKTESFWAQLANRISELRAGQWSRSCSHSKFLWVFLEPCRTPALLLYVYRTVNTANISKCFWIFFFRKVIIKTLPDDYLYVFFIFQYLEIKHFSAWFSHCCSICSLTGKASLLQPKGKTLISLPESNYFPIISLSLLSFTPWTFHLSPSQTRVHFACGASSWWSWIPHCRNKATGSGKTCCTLPFVPSGLL